MFINKLNQLYKPQRLLYYQEATEDEIRCFCQGNVPEIVAKYANRFGTYDYPGVFFLKSMGKPVIGIEFRENDPRVEYPEDLPCVNLPGSFFYSIEIDNEIPISREMIRELFDGIARDDDAHRTYSDLCMQNDPEVIAVFNGYNKIRILHEWRLESDRAQVIICDDMDGQEKSDLYRTAYFDPITTHYNWNHLVAFLEMPMDDGIRDYAFVHFDVKEFRVINEVYGHIAANKVLCNIVRAMNEADFVYASARCHNDNFAMMIKDMPEEETLAVLGRFFEDLSHLEEDPNYKIYFRCGVVPMQRAILSGNRVADAAKLAQSLGRNHNRTEITIYTDKMHDDISWGNFIKAYVETAIENDEFFVVLQPKLDIWTETVEGAEALIRWNYKGKQFLSPGRFIPFFEKDGTIGKIDDIVLTKVCQALARWKEEGRCLHPISVNLSRTRLYAPNLTEHLSSIVDAYGVEHKLIDFELTESATYDDRNHLIQVLSDLRERGFKISMDDFGTGYSSLSLLTEMPLDTLKIDKSFVDKVACEPERKDDIIVIRHILALARELGFVSLAEGAEEEKQVERLRELGCSVVQGYYYSKPLPVEEYEKKYVRLKA
ncbi:MAG: EAL domain-containing protein [Clostridiales bacterium]|nr:EAL domain-containing protein [Clostridiales bacterium]